MSMRGVKIGNEYQRALGAFYEQTPKAVFAALAFSALDRIYETNADTEQICKHMVQEWLTLNQNGIVPQVPKA